MLKTICVHTSVSWWFQQMFVHNETHKQHKTTKAHLLLPLYSQPC